MTTNTTKKGVLDVFLDGSRKGFSIAITSIIPNVVMAYIAIHILTVTGVIGILGHYCGPVMAIFGLPGESIAVFLSALMSMGGAAAAAAGLYDAGILTGTHVTILLPAILLMGAKIQYLGRLLGTAEVQKRFYPILLLISLVNAMLSMLVMRACIPFFTL